MGSLSRTTLAALIAGSMLVSAGNALADFASGKDLLQWCNSNDYEKEKCLGYIMGVADMMRYSIVSGWKACAAPAVQVRDVTIQFLQLHPEYRHLDGAGLVAEAIGRAFPCQ